MSESINDDSDFSAFKNPNKNSFFNKFIIIAKKQKKYFFIRFRRLTKAEKIKEGFIILLSILSYILYYLSLGGCDGTQTECLKNSNIAYYYFLVNYCFLSAAIVSLIFFLMWSKIISKFHLIHLIIVFGIFFMSDTGSTLMHHGIYNIIGFTIFLICYSSFLIIIIKIQEILNKKSLPIKLIVINIIILIIIFGRYSFHESLKNECKDWDLGLNNTRIEDDKNKYPCQIFRPISCHINYFNNKQDLSNLLKLTCSSGANSNQAINARNQLIKYINKKEFEHTKRFGFPLTNTPKFIINSQTTPDSFTKNVYDNIIDMDNISKPIPQEEYPEVILTFDETNYNSEKSDKSAKYIGKIDINIKKNEIISESRKKLENPNSLFNNIIMIYTDAVSRAHFKRKMPKTCAFIEKLMKNNFENDFFQYENELNKINSTNYLINKRQNEQNLEKFNTTNIILNNNITQRILNNGKNITNKTTHINKKPIIKSKHFEHKHNLNTTKLFLKKKNHSHLLGTKHIITKKMKDISKNKTTLKNKNISLIKFKKYKKEMKIKNILKKNKHHNFTNINKLKQKVNKTTEINKKMKQKENITKKTLDKTKRKDNRDIKPRKLEIINNTIDIDNYFENKYYAYQFLKYHTFNSGTKFNAVPMFYGKSLYNSQGVNIIKYFKQLGYITAQSIDMCSKEVWEPDKEPPNLDFDFWDHENVAMFCDPSYMDRKSLYSIYKGVYSFLRRCFYGKEVHDYVFEYGKKFWETYPENKKFLRLGFNDGHESTFEVLKYLDEPLVDFLEYFLNKGYLKNTAIFIISDHGNHMPGIYNLFLSEQFETERVLGNLFLIVNNGNLTLTRNKLEEFKLFHRNVMINQQSIITPYDVYDTMVHIIGGNENKNKIFSQKGKSVFMEIDNSVRNCNFFDQDDEEKGLCRCVPNDKYEKFVYYDNNK